MICNWRYCIFARFMVSSIFILSSISLFGQVSKQEYLYPPRVGLPRYLENYSSFDTIGNKSTYQKIKYNRLGTFGFISFGGELRYRYEYFDNYRLGGSAQDKQGYLLDRYLLHADFRNKYFRLFTQFKLSSVYGRSPGPRALDRDLGDISQLFLELPFKFFKEQVHIQIGRREFFYGSNRWIDFREGPNSRLSFDGISFALKGRVEFDAFHLYPVNIGMYGFDNLPNFDRGITGVHFKLADWISDNDLSIYGLYHKLDREILNSRLSFGLRNKLHSERIKLDLESIVQVADDQDRIYSALSIGLDFDYRLLEINDKMQIGFISLYTSGTNRSGSMTFNPLYPTNKNFRNIDLFGKHNLFYLQPYVHHSFSAKDKLSIGSIWYWKSSLKDNVYSIPGGILFSPTEFDARYLGIQFNLTYKYFLNHFFQAEMAYRGFISSKELSRQTLSENVNYFSLTFVFRF